MEEGETVWLCPCPSPWSQTYEYGPPFPPLARLEILTLSPKQIVWSLNANTDKSGLTETVIQVWPEHPFWSVTVTQ